MKTIPLILLGAFSANFCLSAELAPPTDRPDRGARSQDHVVVPTERPGPEGRPRLPIRPPMQREKVTHLGVGVAPAGPSLAAQLGLAPGTGLVVTEVTFNSPATEKIRLHDVLVEIDGQLLINPEQLAVLIRNHRPGEEVTIKLIRRGQAETIKTKLSEHEIPAAHPGPMGHGPMPSRPGVTFPGGIPLPGQPSTVERQIEVNRRTTRGEEPALRQRRVVVRDQTGSIELNVSERGGSVIVKDLQGETVFTGPLNSPADFEAIPEAIRPRLEKIPETRGLMAPQGHE